MRAPIVVLLASLMALPVASAGWDPGYNPKDPANATWQEEGVLAIGGGGLTEADVDKIYDMGFRAIVNFRGEHSDPEAYIRAKGMAFLEIPIQHTVDINVTHLETFVAFMEEQKAAGRAVYAHCTHGWHRAATFAVAYHMATKNITYDEAAKIVVPMRAGSVMRSPAALLDYEAKLRGQDALTVILHAPQSRPEPNQTMPVDVEVLAHGQPQAGARVKVWSEESGLRFDGTTGADGRFTFTYTPPKDGAWTDHLYARASSPGYLDGADNAQLFFMVPIRGNAGIELDARLEKDGIHVVAERNGRPVHARFVAYTAEGWSSGEVSNTGYAVIPLPPAGGEVVVRAERWGYTGASVRLVVPAPTPAEPVENKEPVDVTTPTPGEVPAIVETPGEAPDPESPVDGTPVQGTPGTEGQGRSRSNLWLIYSAGALVAMVGFGALVQARRNQA